MRALNAALADARRTAQTQITEAVGAAKAAAAADAAKLATELDAKLAAAEAEISRARAAALAAIKPVAESATRAMIQSLTGHLPTEELTATRVDAAMNKAA
jgi:F0F1-type ATP synthase membrane subunit b/b'